MRALLLVLLVLGASVLGRPRARVLRVAVPRPGVDAVPGTDAVPGRGAVPGSGDRRRGGAVPVRPRRSAVPVPDAVTVLDLLVVAVEAGASVPDAVAAVGDVVADPVGTELRAAAGALRLGAPWSAAWGRSPELRAATEPMEAAWTTGAGAAPAMRSAATGLRRERERAAREAAARLGVRLVLPLGLCFLPAFVLIGLVPVLVSLAGTLLR